MVTSFMQEKKNITHEYHLLLSGISFYTVLMDKYFHKNSFTLQIFPQEHYICLCVCTSCMMTCMIILSQVLYSY